MAYSEIALIVGLYLCTFLPGSWDKKLVRSLYQQYQEKPDKSLSDKQKVWLVKLAHKYKRQLSPVHKLALEVEDWCECRGYIEPFVQEGQWWAYPPNSVIPVPVDWICIC